MTQTKQDKITADATSELSRALRQRLTEFHKLRRDMIGKQAETLAVLEQRILQYQALVKEAETCCEMLRRSQSELTALDADAWSEANLQSELGAAMRKLENGRLELMARMARIGELENHKSSTSAATVTPASLHPELTSLSFRQFLRWGTAFTLPLLLVLLLVAAVIAAAFFLSVRM